MKRIVTLLLAITAIISTFSLVCTASSSSVFVPSIADKPGVEMVPFTVIIDGKEVEVDGLLWDEAKDIIEKYLKQSFVIVTPYKLRNTYNPNVSDQKNDEIKKNLEYAYLELSELTSIGEISETVEALLDKYAKEIDSTKSDKDLVVTDLFDITTSDTLNVTGDLSPEAAGLFFDGQFDELNEFLSENGLYVRLKFDLNLSEDDNSPAVLVHDFGQDSWYMVEEDHVIRNDDGTLSIDFQKLGQVAFVKLIGDNGNPKTGDNLSMYIWIAVAVVCVGAELVLILTNRKKKNNEND